MTEKQIIAIGDLNYLWGLSVTMAKALEYDPDEIGNIGQMFKNIEFYLKNGDEEEEGKALPKPFPPVITRIG